jgi:hypothetical protein
LIAIDDMREALSVDKSGISLTSTRSTSEVPAMTFISPRETRFMVMKTIDNKDSEQLIIQFCQKSSVLELFGLPCRRSPEAAKANKPPNSNDPQDIDVEDPPYERYYCLDKNTFDTMLKAETLAKRYRRGSAGQVYRLNLALPFKLRRAIPGFNTTLDQGIQIAGSFGWRWRISDTRDYHVDFPVVSAGLTTLNIDMGTAPAAHDSNTHTLGVTASSGVVLELSDFQLGIMMGVDRATGDTGKDWRYNGKLWYSFSVGYSFLKNDSLKNDSK